MNLTKCKSFNIQRRPPIRISDACLAFSLTRSSPLFPRGVIHAIWLSEDCLRNVSGAILLEFDAETGQALHIKCQRSHRQELILRLARHAQSESFTDQRDIHSLAV